MQKKLVIFCLALSLVLTLLHYLPGQYGHGLHLAMYSECSLDLSALEDFQREHPNMAITVQRDIPKAQYAEWLANSFLSGEEPAIFVVPPEDVEKYLQLGALQDLSDLSNLTALSESAEMSPPDTLGRAAEAIDASRYLLTINTGKEKLLLGISPRSSYPKLAMEILMQLK